MVSKHYYMGSQRVASSMADVPSQIASPPASGGGEGGEEFASANLSSPDDPVIIDFISTMNCVYNASIDLAFDESLSMPELDQINFHNCEGEEFPPEELAQEDPMCLCEQSVYWGNIYGADCSSRNVMYWYHPDYLGSVEAITDVRGELYQFFHNTIWGDRPLRNKPVACFREGASMPRGQQDQKAFTYKDFSSRFRFNGKERDEETGNYYYGARYYDPKVSVWLSVDPLAGEAPHLTPYRFSFNNPLNFVDPNGLFEGDFYDLQGNYLGRDGFNDGKKYYVHNPADIAAVRSATSNGQTFSIPTGRSRDFIPIPTPKEANALNQIGIDTEASGMEEALSAAKTPSGMVNIERAQPSAKGEVDVKPAIYSNYKQGFTLLYDAHGHPVGQDKTVSYPAVYVPESSMDDRTIRGQRASTLGYDRPSVVVGKYTTYSRGQYTVSPDRVATFYDSQGDIATMKMSDLIKLSNKVW